MKNTLPGSLFRVRCFVVKAKLLRKMAPSKLAIIRIAIFSHPESPQRGQGCELKRIISNKGLGKKNRIK